MSVFHWTSESCGFFNLSRREVPKICHVCDNTPSSECFRFDQTLQRCSLLVYMYHIWQPCRKYLISWASNITESGDTERDIAIARHPTSQSLEYLWLLLRPYSKLCVTWMQSMSEPCVSVMTQNAVCTEFVVVGERELKICGVPIR